MQTSGNLRNGTYDQSYLHILSDCFVWLCMSPLGPSDRSHVTRLSSKWPWIGGAVYYLFDPVDFYLSLYFFVIGYFDHGDILIFTYPTGSLYTQANRLEFSNFFPLVAPIISFNLRWALPHVSRRSEKGVIDFCNFFYREFVSIFI